MNNLLELLNPFTWDGLIVFVIVGITSVFSVILFISTIAIFLYCILDGSYFTETEKPPK